MSSPALPRFVGRRPTRTVCCAAGGAAAPAAPAGVGAPTRARRAVGDAPTAAVGGPAGSCQANATRSTGSTPRASQLIVSSSVASRSAILPPAAVYSFQTGKNIVVKCYALRLAGLDHDSSDLATFTPA